MPLYSAPKPLPLLPWLQLKCQMPKIWHRGATTIYIPSRKKSRSGYTENTAAAIFNSSKKGNNKKGAKAMWSVFFISSIFYSTSSF